MSLTGLFAFVQNLTLAQVLAYFWPFFLLDMLRYVIIESLLIFKFLFNRKRRERERAYARHQLFAERPIVSIIVPGKNEGKHIPALANSLSNQTYNNFELIIVDDGSDDNTAMICRQLLKQGKIDRFFRNEVRGGKASGANTALRFSQGKYIIHIDADSHLAEDAIEQILLPFYLDERVGAVGGDVRVANEDDSFATRLQTIEYIKTISAGRVAASELGILRIISGAHGAFRKDVLAQVYGWDVGPGLDGDITLKIRKLGYRVVHAVHAVCYTNVPLKFANLRRQRYRWDRSLVRFRLRKHLNMLAPAANFRSSSFFSIIENIVFNVFFDFKWIIYVIYMLYTAPHYLGYVFIINYFLYFIANIIQFVVARALISPSYRAIDGLTPFFLPLMPFYTGLYLRAVRTYAYLMEFLHKTSYDDPWNPWKVSRIAKKEKL
ncbi:glycosyltransferase [Alteromonas ponticola]|uniref:Glycosyltransferase n=1 Tax=Alteromonas aquimaris TaxID=2998417 RepID=A0ABT3PAC3_9ALTE|nr:glycosyltransferase [Alteromonas aquimaris]MCW8109655.1 glycosyltransferase [Alteromonas aquimaris]